MTALQTAAIGLLRAAKLEIETRGWTRNQGGGVEGRELPCCPIIALVRANADAGSVDSYNLAREAYAKATVGSGTIRDVFTWNDHYERQRGQVLAGFDKGVRLIESGAVGI